MPARTAHTATTYDSGSIAAGTHAASGTPGERTRPRPATPDDPRRRPGRRSRTLAAAVALPMSATLLVGCSSPRNEPAQSTETPISTSATPTSTTTPTTATTPTSQPTPTVTATLRGIVGAPPRGVAQITDTADGLIAEEMYTLRIWHRGEHGWENRGQAKESHVQFSPDGQVGYTGGEQYLRDGSWYSRVSYDGGRTWQRLRLPRATCSSGAALLDEGIYVQGVRCGRRATTAPSPRPRAFWLPRGSSTWQPRPAPPTAAVGHLGDILVAWSIAPGKHPVDRVPVSRDTELTWQRPPNPCADQPRSFHPDSWIFGTVYAQCRDTDGTRTIFTLGGDNTWEPSLTLPKQAGYAIPLGADHWLAPTATGMLLVTPNDTTAINPPWRLRSPFNGVGTVGTDVLVSFGRLSYGKGAPVYVSHDGGLTWQKEKS